MVLALEDALGYSGLDIVREGSVLRSWYLEPRSHIGRVQSVPTSGTQLPGVCSSSRHGESDLGSAGFATRSRIRPYKVETNHDCSPAAVALHSN